MPRQPFEYRHIHAAADTLEPLLASAVRRGLERTSERVQIQDLAIRLAAGDVRGALALLSTQDAREDMGLAATIMKEAFMRGGRLGAKIVREVAG